MRLVYGLGRSSSPRARRGGNGAPLPPRDGGRGASSPPAHTEREPLLNLLTTEPQEMSSAFHELA